ncbi:MAG: hypothetical protein ABSA97_07305 [Verrucomicrobiia bacterium]
MSFQTDMADGFRQAQAVRAPGVTASCAGKTFPIIPGDLVEMLMLLPDGGGFMEKPTLGFICNEMDNLPEMRSGTILTIDGQSYRIVHVDPGLACPLTNIFCKGVQG